MNRNEGAYNMDKIYTQIIKKWQPWEFPGNFILLMLWGELSYSYNEWVLLLS